MIQKLITRPILCSVIAILIVLMGYLSIENLPIAQYPNITPPIVNISAQYPGADADVAQKSVAIPLEEAVNGVEDMLYLQSTCGNDGSVSINVFFRVGTDPSMAQVNVQNKIQSAMALLPSTVTDQGVTVRKQSTGFLLMYTLKSDSSRFANQFLANYANLNIVPILQRVNGVGNVIVFGGDQYAMRIWLNPVAMAGYGISMSDVQSAIAAQNQNAAAGQIGMSPSVPGQELSIVLRFNGRLVDKDQFDNIVVKSNDDGSLITIKDIGRSELGMRTYSSSTKINGENAPVIAVMQSPGSNAISVRKACDEAMSDASKLFPEGIEYGVSLDTTKFISISIEEVIYTLLLTFVLVFIVVYLFVQRVRASVIPALAVPISLIGAFLFFDLLGFSINLITLLSLVLAIGLVVDDTIVVIDAVQQHIDDFKMSPEEATKAAMKQLTGVLPVITFVLVAVYIPVATIGGTAGALYSQFAVVLSASLALSLLVSLSLSPSLCALMLRPSKLNTGEAGKFFHLFNVGYEKWHKLFIHIVEVFNKRKYRLWIFILATTILAIWLMRVVPTGFIPNEDQGYFIVSVQAPQGTAMDRTSQIVARVDSIVRTNTNVEKVLSITGFSMMDNIQSPNAASLFVKLKPWSERKSEKNSVFTIVRETQGELGVVKDAICMAINPPAIMGMGSSGGVMMFVQAQSSSDYGKLDEETKAFVSSLAKTNKASSIYTTFNMNNPQYLLELDSAKINKLGVSYDELYMTMQALFGSLYINQFNEYGKAYNVIVQALPEFRSNIDNLQTVYVPNRQGAMVPISSLVEIKPVEGPNYLMRFNLMSAVELNIAPDKDVSSGSLLAAVNTSAEESLSPGYTYQYAGEAFQEIEVSKELASMFLLSFVVVYLLLAALYESWLLPIPVLLSLPFSAFGAFGLLYVTGGENDLFAQIGLIMLIGLAAKNAILIVEYAEKAYAEGADVVHAALEAARLRFRPILMTSFAFILGVLPLVFASGAGANSRHSIGVTVCGGMLITTLLGLLVVPSTYIIFKKLGNRKNRRKES